MKKLGNLDPVPLKNQWPDEARNFTPWLAGEEGLTLLGEALGMELEAQDTEVAVGSYRADIVAVDLDSAEKVVIENQLTPTDHGHIGQLITYAAGVSATTVVWVAERIKEEHRRAIEWLNDNTVSGLGFYAVEVQLWQIGDSLPAARLSVEAMPDIEVKTIRAAGKSGAEKLYFEFWTAFIAYLETTGAEIRRRKPPSWSWYNVPIGKSGVQIAVTARMSRNDIGCELYMDGPDAKQLFKALHQDKAAIEADADGDLEWQELPDKKASRIIRRASIDPNDSEAWPTASKWYIEQVAAFRKAFIPRVKSFIPAENGEED